MVGENPESGFSAWWAAVQNRREVRRALKSPPANGFVSQPEPRTIGLFARGRQMIAGNFLFGGHLVEAPGVRLWDITVPDPGFAEAAHGFAWLDDLAAVGDGAARAKAQDWTWAWIADFGQGRRPGAPGWSPDLTGRRLIRWINHALLLLNGRERDDALAFYHSLSAQVHYLNRNWRKAAPGLPRFEALCGLIYAGFALIGMEDRVAPATEALAAECEREIDAAGGIPTRNPEELLEVFTLLIWAAGALGEAGRPVPEAHLAAIERIAPTLRLLRHADGGLARFHGGGRGLEGRLDQALADSGVKPGLPDGLAMGFARLSHGRTSVIVDASDPPSGAAGAVAHASTLAFELTSGRRPLIVNCGSGQPFGQDWHRAGRATASHSTLTLDGFSSSRFARGGREVLEARAHVEGLDLAANADGATLEARHNGWMGSHGLLHARRLSLSGDGRRLAGQDSLIAPDDPAIARLAAAIERSKSRGIGFAVRFHLHPEADAALDLGGTAVSIGLRSGEIWVFRHDGALDLSLEPSVYLEKGRLSPRATKQIVLAGILRENETRIGWTLAKAQDTPLAIRDLDRDDLPSPA
ncbi:heparinase [Aliigemmobacter aestuarii]|uniref:Heparinase n=1 Tax=Aliigemmobacter aestuarii TaxID=1445661 RepID=A0A4S3MQJ0_9RHOB|nr:heparinase II/III family protein [Gemmobacter aestuarii]THD83651.1 heparinase [Gemmobacter aestuarii]